jgi:transposase
MDMRDAFIKAVKEAVPDAGKITAFDRFHVSRHINDALDKARCGEHAGFKKLTGESPLKGEGQPTAVAVGREEEKNANVHVCIFF